MKKISIIVPVYNIENYLKKSIDSIIQQTYQNIEIILIDDGSTDKSGIICDYYQSIDKRIKVLHKENNGLGEARNSGLKLATGDYLFFCDSDDYLELNAMEIMLSCLLKNNSDICVCGRFLNRDNGDVSTMFVNGTIEKYSGSKALERFLCGKIDSSVCDKIYKRELFDNVLYSSEFFSEDIPVTYKLLKKSTNVVDCGVPLYHYYQRVNSISRTKFTSKHMGMVVYAEQIRNDIKKSMTHMVEFANGYYYKQLIVAYYLSNKSDCGWQIKEDLINRIKNERLKIIFNKNLKLKYKLYCLKAFLYSI